ncbi:DUF2125 domain-containing protein [Pontivivens insulae]|uniref:DUF2125 domain-containing protein n=1 Tax=Pontivivens insulae TaxID=1639689 RepID=A0A2R8AFA7_9RHOB|nr:DUF2125 domain-containing protein [Pontivivens insulae]RED11994.1 hypothetical protein DFR53_2707 [Pontivivens insulae]SPF30750.1 hypothetical protein POI8812_03093 [Pontivivens insulae]
MRGVKILVGLFVVGCLAWAGYWWVNAGIRRTAVETWFEQRRAEGWVADYEELVITGFPNRVDTKISGLELADPRSGWAWSADEFQLLTLSYQPFAIIAVWPGEQRFSTPGGGTISAEGQRLRASLAVTANGAFELVRSRMEGRDIAIRLPDGETLFVPILDAASDALDADESGTVHRLGLNLENVELSEGLKARFDATGLLPPAISVVHFDATATFDGTVSLRTIERDAPELASIRIDDASGAWGELDLRAFGDLTADAQGLAEGELDIRARNWEAMLDLAVANGALDEGSARAARFGLGLLASSSGDRNSLEAPITFRDGQARLGPLPIGSAPSLQRQ